jgi:hypothetical protein
MSQFANEILVQMIKHSNFNVFHLFEDKRLTEEDIKIIKNQIHSNVYFEEFKDVLSLTEMEELSKNYPIVSAKNLFLHELGEFNGSKISFIENYPDNVYVDKYVKRVYTIFLELGSNNNCKTYKKTGDENEILSSLIDLLETHDLAAANITCRKRFDTLFSSFPWTDNAREIAYRGYFLDRIRFVGIGYFKENVLSELEEIQRESEKIFEKDKEIEFPFRRINLACNAFLHNYTQKREYIKNVLADQLYFFNLNKSAASLSDILLCKSWIKDYVGCVSIIKENPVLFDKIKKNRNITRNIKSFKKAIF